MQPSVSDVQVLERQWALEPVTASRDPRAHVWSAIPELDGMECVRCGTVVSMTKFPLSRDGSCEEWLT